MRKNMFIIWIGDKPVPIENIESWRIHHPEWNFRVVGNYELHNRGWHNQRLIDAYLQEGRYAGVADVMRYELLYEEGGFCPPADAYCLRPTDELFTNGDAFAVYENERVRHGLTSPLYACKQGNEFARLLVHTLPKKPPMRKGRNLAPVKVTGNYYMRRMIAIHTPDITIFPSHYFIPIHFTGDTYTGRDKPYAVQLWGTTSEWMQTETNYLEKWMQQAGSYGF
jgi:hypothetical protein